MAKQKTTPKLDFSLYDYDVKLIKRALNKVIGRPEHAENFNRNDQLAMINCVAQIMIIKPEISKLLLTVLCYGESLGIQARLVGGLHGTIEDWWDRYTRNNWEAQIPACHNTYIKLVDTIKEFIKIAKKVQKELDAPLKTKHTVITITNHNGAAQ